MELIELPWPRGVGQQHEEVEKAESNLEMHVGLTESAVILRKLAEWDKDGIGINMLKEL